MPPIYVSTYLPVKSTVGLSKLGVHTQWADNKQVAQAKIDRTISVRLCCNYYDDAGRLVPYDANEGRIQICGNPNAP